MSASKIEWTDETWNPTTGCDRISPGCDNCYAMRMAARLKRMGQAKYQRDGHAETSGPGFGVSMHPDELARPLSWRQPRRVFVDSMSDLFHAGITHDFIRRVFATMEVTPQHTYQVLTKRALRAWRLAPALPWPGNVWMGVSVENADQIERTRWLRGIPASLRFLSIEPLLGPLPDLDLTGIGWVIVGGESGPGARPMHPDWARSIRDQCVAAGVPFFFKQHGAWVSIADCPDHDALYVSNRKARDGEDQAVLDDVFGRRCSVPAGVVQYSGAFYGNGHTGAYEVVDGHPSYLTFNVGKHAAGRLLDGREWSEVPR